MSEVLQDVRQFQKSIDQKKKQLERKMKELSNYKLSNMMPHVASQSKDLQDSSFDSSATKNISDASCQTSIISTCEKSCETDHDFVKPRERVFSGSGIGELKSRIQEKKATVEIINKKISNTETLMKALGNENRNTVSKVVSELDAAKDTILRKNEEIGEWKQNVVELKRSWKSDIQKSRDHEKVSAQLIESQRLVHEKEIQDLNQKLQRQISKSQTLNEKEKNLLKLVEQLTSSNSEKSDAIQSLTNQMNIISEQEDALRCKVSEQALALKLSNVGEDSEIRRLNRQVEVLDDKVQSLEKNVKELKVDLARKCCEKTDLEEDFKTHKDQTEKIILEKEKKILCLDKELERTKGDAYICRTLKESKLIIVEETEKFTKVKLNNQKVKAEMERKFERNHEILGLMKDSLTGIAAMHEDTSERLVEAVRNTAKASKIVINDVKSKFLEFENELENLWIDGKAAIAETSVKKEPERMLKSPVQKKIMALENMNDEVHVKFEETSSDVSTQNSSRAFYSPDEFEMERAGRKKTLKRKFME